MARSDDLDRPSSPSSRIQFRCDEIAFSAVGGRNVWLRSRRRKWLWWCAFFGLFLVLGFLGRSWYWLLGALPPALLLIATGTGVHFCAACGALVRRRFPKVSCAFCPGCGRLIDPAHVRIGPAGSMDLSGDDWMNHPEPCSKLVALVILLAIKDRASEVCFEPGRVSFRLSYCVEGITYDMVPPPLHLKTAIAGTIKGIAGLDPNDGIVQEGSIQVKLGPRVVTTAVTVTPTGFGERCVLDFPSALNPEPAGCVLK